MKEELLNQLQGKWIGENDASYTLEITNERIINHGNQESDLFWRNDLEKWIIPGLSIVILSIKDHKLHAETPKGQLNSGVAAYIKA